MAAVLWRGGSWPASGQHLGQSKKKHGQKDRAPCGLMVEMEVIETLKQAFAEG